MKYLAKCAHCGHFVLTLEEWYNYYLVGDNPELALEHRDCYCGTGHTFSIETHTCVVCRGKGCDECESVKCRVKRFGRAEK